MKNTKQILLSSCLTCALAISFSPSVFASEGITQETVTLDQQVLKEPHTVENELTEEDLQHKLIFDQIQKEDEEAALNFESEDVAQDKASFSSTLTEIEPNSEMSTQSVTKSFLRSQWNFGSNLLIASGYYLSGTFLQHSLQDYPSTLKYYHGSNQASSIQYSSEFQKELTIFRAQLPKNGATYYSKNTSIEFSANRDHFLALHRANATFAAQKLSSGWFIIATVHDLYNFEYWNYGSGMGIPANFVSLVNNYAADNQRLGVIVPYDIFFYINTR
ncbi:hypothetical protein NST99_21585 [Paenibacillus sp. FSL L8-0470]|uniref:hypothetical protein n=1 Tax=unclassified Paenibacillus TaxID=185978 RepID=UPI0030F6393D